MTVAQTVPVMAVDGAMARPRARFRAPAWQIGAGFILSLLLLGTVAVVSHRSIDALVDRAQVIEHTHLVINDLEELLSRLKDAEAGQRGYLLTGEAGFLGPYEASAAEVPVLLASLLRTTVDNPRQQARVAELEPLVRERLKLLERGINLRRTAAGARDLLPAIEDGKRVMDTVQTRIRRAIDAEQALLAERSLAADAQAERVKQAIIFGNLVALAILLAAFLLLRAQLVYRARAERAARAQAGELADLYNNAPIGYHSVNEDGVFVRINDTWLSWLGYRREELLGKRRHIDIMTPQSAERLAREARPLIDVQGNVKDFEIEYLRKDGSTFTGSVSGTVLRDEQGRYVASRTMVIDVTERRRAEDAARRLTQELEQRRAELEVTNKELESFSYSVSHDLRSPLRAIDGFSRMIEEDYGDRFDDEGRRLLGVVRDNAAQMARLIDDLLAFSRLGRQAIAVSDIDMAGLVREVVAEAARDRVAEVEIGALPPAAGDRALLRQVWANLIGNAVKYSGKKPAPRVRISGEAADGERVYCVEDNGVGFDMRYYDKLFGVFQRLHAAAEFEGTGVGLAIVQRVVTRHGGRVWAEGRPDEGARFFFSLPAVVEGAGMGPAAGSARKESLNG